MPKISALPVITSPDSADELPIVDTSTSSTKKMTLTKLKEWLQSLVGWVNTAAIADGAVTNAKISTTAITLGYAEKPSSFTTTSSTSVIVTGLSTSVVIPSGGRKIEITTWASFLDSGTESFISLQIWDGVVGSGTMLAQITPRLSSNNRQVSAFVMAIQAPSAGSKTYNIGVKTTAGIAEVKGESNSPSFILVKAI